MSTSGRWSTPSSTADIPTGRRCDRRTRPASARGGTSSSGSGTVLSPGARRFDPELLHESVDGEWSFIETLRHLVFATDAWVRRAILGDPSPWHPLDLPWDEMADTPGVPRDREVRPSLDVVLELRRDRMSTVRAVLEGLTDESLAGHTESVEGPGWPQPRSYPVRECLLCILTEEWEHRLYAERDLDALAHRARP